MTIYDNKKDKNGVPLCIGQRAIVSDRLVKKYKLHSNIVRICRLKSYDEYSGRELGTSVDVNTLQVDKPELGCLIFSARTCELSVLNLESSPDTYVKYKWKKLDNGFLNYIVLERENIFSTVDDALSYKINNFPNLDVYLERITFDIILYSKAGQQLDNLENY